MAGPRVPHLAYSGDGNTFSRVGRFWCDWRVGLSWRSIQCWQAQDDKNPISPLILFALFLVHHSITTTAH